MCIKVHAFALLRWADAMEGARQDASPHLHADSYDSAMSDALDRSPPLFIDAIEIPAYLDSDRGMPYAERLHRDRTIGASLATRDPVRRVRAWRRAQMSSAGDSGEARSIGERLERGRRLIAFVMVSVGAFAGTGVAAAAFHYDGTWPVNVVTVFALLVLVQIALVVLSMFLMLPRFPGVSVLQDLLGALNPGAFVAAVYRRFVRLDERRADVLVFSAARGPVAMRFARWQMLAWSQVAAIAFNLAALATAAALIAFTDLAFGWSTTLRLDSGDVLNIVHVLATPWAGWWPDAVPSLALIESSRFFRLASSPPAAISAEALTGWWPFLLAAIVTYGLIPRIVLLIVALSRVHATTLRLLLDDPQVKALLDRMDAAEVVLGANDVETPEQNAARLAAGLPGDTAAQAIAIVWSGAIDHDNVNAWSAQHLRKQVTRTVDAGGGRALQDDKATVRDVADASPSAVLLFVRAWEAPLLDLQDFIEDLRAAVGHKCSIIVVPVGPSGASATESQRATWSRWVGRVADSALYMESGA